MLQDRNETAKAQVGYLSPPQCLHAGQVQILDGNGVVAMRQLPGLLEVKILTAVCNCPVQAGKVLPGFSSVIAASLFPAESAVGFGKLLEGLLERLGCQFLRAIADYEKILQADVHARYFGSRGTECLMLGIGDEDEENIPQGVPLDGEGFDLSLDLVGFEKTVLLFADNNQIAGDGVARLLQGEALVLEPLPERRRPDLPSGHVFDFPRLCVLEEQQVGFIDSLHHILDRLRAEFFPEGIPR